MKPDVIVTCEHASPTVPPAYRHLFRGYNDVLRSHRGYDPNAIEMATNLSRQLNCTLFEASVSRLLVELNRSIGHPALFSEFTKSLSETEKNALLDAYYVPYRRTVEQEIGSRVRKNQTVLHLSVHTFTPIYDGKPRIADIGLLFDPAREPEATLMQAWQRDLSKKLPQFKTRRNYPYHGRTDGFTTHLRKSFQATKYLGIEIEIRNSLRPNTAGWITLVDEFSALADAFSQTSG
jgi:predicted N-formylglutamate amidohydrolase